MEFVLSVLGVNWTYSLTPEALRVRWLAFTREVPWSHVVGIAFCYADGPVPMHLLVAHRAPGATKNKLLTTNLPDASDPGACALLNALAQGMPQAWRGQGELMQLRRAFGISNVWVYATVAGIIVAVLGGGVVYALMNQ